MGFLALSHCGWALCAGSHVHPPGASRDELRTMGGGVPTPGLPAASERQKPGGLCSFRPRAACLLLQPGVWEGSGLWVSQSCSAAAPGVWLISPSALVMLIPSAPSSWYFLPVFLPLSISSLVCLYFSHACHCIAIRELKTLSGPWWKIGELAPSRTAWWFKKVMTFFCMGVSLNSKHKPQN